MAYIKDEYVITKTSGADINWVLGYIRDNFLEPKQEDPDNRDINDNYKDHYFGDLFDSRDGSLYRVYSVGTTIDGLKGDPDAGDSYFSVVNIADVITEIDNSGTFLKVTDASVTYATKAELPDLTDYRVENDIIQLVDGKIAAIQIDEVIIG